MDRAGYLVRKAYDIRIMSILAIPVTILISFGSYRYMEIPLMKFRTKKLKLDFPQL